METDPKPIYGNWAHGWALDQHTLRSRQDGGGAPGRPRFTSERSEIGEALYRLKYRLDRSQVAPIARAVVEFVRCRPELSDVGAVLAVPPSNADRSFQPVEAIAFAVAAELGLPSPDDYLLKVKPTSALKNMEDTRERREELDGAFAVADRRFQDLHVLLFDDLFRSGETLKAVTVTLLFEGKVGNVSVVTATYARSKT